MTDTDDRRQAHVGALIKASKPLANHNVTLEFIPGLVEGAQSVTGVPIAIDNEFIQIETEDDTIWIAKKTIAIFQIHTT